MHQVEPISVIIVNWNTRDLLLNCLRTLIAEQPPVLDIIVVDNNSRDDSVSAVKQQYPEVTLIETGANLGFAAANNIGIAASKHDYLLLLNPDTEIHSGLIATLYNRLANDKQVAAVGPLVLNPDGSLQTSCYPFPTLGGELWRLLHLDKLIRWGTYDMSQWSREEGRHVDILQGVCLLVKRQAMAQVGNFDSDYFMYTEEVDLCFRLAAVGWRMYWEPAGSIIHYGGQSTRQAKSAMFIRLYESKIIFFRKHYSLWAVWLYKFILLLISLPRVTAAHLSSIVPTHRKNELIQIGSHYRELIRALPSL